MKNLFIGFLFILFSLFLATESFSKQIANEYILKLSKEKSSNALNYFFQKNGGDKALLSSFEMGAFHVRLGEKERTEFMKEYGQEVKYLEPNFTYKISTIPSRQWALDNNNGTHIDAKKAWGITKGSKEIIVAVVDTGVDYNHEALMNNMWTNSGEIADNGIDDDGNGYIDDVKGWDFANNDNDPFDDNQHGTHCAGIIAANSKTVMGISPNVKIMPLKFLTGSGSGSLAGALKAIEYGTKMGASVLNNSWGGGSFSSALEEAIQAAERKGVLFVAAAGNEYNNNDRRATYPATYKVENVVSVAASTEQGTKAYFSNYGKETVHLFAPGYNILSSVPGNEYKGLSGTSMASPYVSGVAALIYSQYPGITPQEVKKKLTDGVKYVDGLKDLTIANGLLNAYNSLQ